MNIQVDKLSNLFDQLNLMVTLEESLNHVLRDLLLEVKPDVCGLALKTRKGDQFHIRLNKNLSHAYIKEAYFDLESKIIQDLKHNYLLDYHDPKEFKLELDYQHLIVIGLVVKKELLGFLFVQNNEHDFTNDHILKLKMFAGISSMTIKTFHLQHELEHMIQEDELTGLYNHKAFLHNGDYLISQMRRYQRDLSLVLIKMFKYDDIFRTLGSQQLSSIFKMLSQLLKNSLRKSDTIGLIYHDTIGILLPETSVKITEEIASRIMVKIEEIPVLNNSDINWGICSLDDSIGNIEEFIGKANTLIYEVCRRPDCSMLLKDQ